MIHFENVEIKHFLCKNYYFWLQVVGGTKEEFDSNIFVIICYEKNILRPKILKILDLEC